MIECIWQSTSSEVISQDLIDLEPLFGMNY